MWHKLTVEPVDLKAWTGLDYSICKNFSVAEAAAVAPSGAVTLHDFVHLHSYPYPYPYP